MDIYECCRHLSFQAAFFQKESVFFSTECFNGLFLLDLRSGQVQFLGQADEECCACQAQLHQFAAGYGESLFFVSLFGGRFITEYQMETERQQRYYYDEEKSCAAVMDDECLWLLPDRISSGIVRFDLREKKFSALCWPEEITERGKDEFLGGAVLWGRLIWSFLKNTNCLLCIDLERKDIRMVDLEDGIALQAIGKCGNDLMAAYGNGVRLLKLSGLTGECLGGEFAEGQGDECDVVQFLFAVKDRVYAVMRMTPAIIIFDREKGEMLSRIDLTAELNRLPDERAGKPCFGGYRADGGKIYLYPEAVDRMAVIDEDGGKNTLLEVCLPAEEADYLKEKVLPGVLRRKFDVSYSEFLYEAAPCRSGERGAATLEDLLQCASGEDKGAEKKKDYCGDLIWGTIKRDCMK